jgi:hypothetical protein
MANEIEDIQQQVMNLFDSEVRELGQEEYREILENLISDFQSRLDCVIEEMQTEGVE